MDDDYESTVETLKDLAAGLNSMRQGAVKIVTASGNRKKVDSAVLELFPAMNLYVSALSRLGVKRRADFDDAVGRRFASHAVRDAVEELWTAEEAWNEFLVSLDASSRHPHRSDERSTEDARCNHFPDVGTLVPAIDDDGGQHTYRLLKPDLAGDVVDVTLRQLLEQNERTALVFLRHFG
jgi:hypothetical protein